MMNSRPVIDLPKTSTERWLDVASWLFVTLAFAVALSNYADLPDTIPTHFNAAGKADGYGPKYMVFLLPIISFVIVAGLGFLVRFPHRFNYLATITPENAAFEYKKAQILLRVVKVLTSLLMMILTWSIVQAVHTQTGDLGAWFWIPVAAIVIAPIVIMVWRKDKNG